MAGAPTGKPPDEINEFKHPATVDDVDKLSLAEIRHLRSVVEGDDPPL